MAERSRGERRGRSSHRVLGLQANMGRIWAVLFSRPSRSAPRTRAGPEAASGAVSMTLNEPVALGVVRKVWVQGERKDFYAAEVQLWRMISRVFSEREKTEIVMAIEAFEEALADVSKLRALDRSEDPRPRRAPIRAHQRNLLELARLGKQLIETFFRPRSSTPSRSCASLLAQASFGDRTTDEERRPALPRGGAAVLQWISFGA